MSLATAIQRTIAAYAPARRALSRIMSATTWSEKIAAAEDLAGWVCAYTNAVYCPSAQEVLNALGIHPPPPRPETHPASPRTRPRRVVTSGAPTRPEHRPEAYPYTQREAPEPSARPITPSHPHASPHLAEPGGETVAPRPRASWGAEPRVGPSTPPPRPRIRTVFVTRFHTRYLRVPRVLPLRITRFVHVTRHVTKVVRE